MNRIIIALLLGLAVSFSAAAEQKKQLGNWDVHYIAFPAPLLTPEIALQYQLQRSKYNAVINISVLDSSTQQPAVTLSAGCYSAIPGTQSDCDEYINFADKALYSAKANGRNQVQSYPPGQRKISPERTGELHEY